MNSPVWYTFELAGKDYEFGLFYCNNCPDMHAHYSSDCFYTYDCELDPSCNLCSLGKQAYEASISYFWLSLISLVGCLLLCERMLYMFLRRDYGHPKILYFLACWLALLQTIAIIVWFSRSKASFDGKCSASEKEDIGLCASSGSVIGISAAVLSVIASGCAAITVKYRNPTYDCGISGIANGKIMGVSHRQWLLAKITPVLVVGFAFQLMATCWHWVHYDTGKEHMGYLLYVDEYLDFDELGFNCLFGPACATSQEFHVEKRHCSAFKRLWKAGYTYLYIDAASVFFFILWFEGLIYFAIKREFGIPLTQYAWPILTTVLHAAAMAAWFVISEAKFGNSCDVYASDDDIDFCADKSPNFSIWSLICLFFAALFFVLLYYRRRDESELNHEVIDEGMIKQKKLPEMPDSIKDSDFDDTKLNDSQLDHSLSLQSKSTDMRPASKNSSKVYPKYDESAPLSTRNKEKPAFNSDECSLCKDP